MTTVNVGFGVSDPSHDLSLTDGSTTLGLILAGGPRVLQEIPLSPPAQAFEIEQKNWTGGHGRRRYDDDPTGYADSDFLWSMTEGRLFPSPQWRFASSLRNNNTSLPNGSVNLAWWKLYGNAPGSRIARYLSIAFTASANYSADKAFFHVRKRGTPGTLTVELCANSSGSPGTVLQTVTQTAANFDGTLSIFRAFNWTGTESLTSGTIYHLKIYGASGDDEDDHWQILGNSSGTSSKYSTNNSSWTAATISMFYRVVDTDTNRQWKFFFLEAALYAVSINDDGSTSLLRMNGSRGTATAGTSTTLTNTNVTMTTNVHTGAYIRIIDGTGDGQFRLIASNTSTQFTVTEAFDIPPDATSKYTVYSSDDWPAVTGTPGIGAVKNRPAVVSGIAYFPQGQSVNIRRMRVNASSHDFAADSMNRADLIGVNVEGTAPLIYAANAATSKIKSASVVTWGTDLTFGTEKPIGGSEYRITNLYTHNRLMKVFKEDGVYTYNNGVVEKDGNQFSDIPDPTTGLAVGTQNGALWWGWAHSVVRQIGANVDDMLNYKRGYDGVAEPRKGYISCIVSALGWLFFVIDGGVSGFSSILCWNGQGWHELFRGWAAGVRIRNAVWQPNFGTRGRLWFDPAGDLVYMDFPLLAANPLKDTSFYYHHEAVCVSATYDAHDQNLYKVLSFLRVFSERGEIEIDYQTNANVGTSTWTVLGTADSQPVEDLDLNLGNVFQVRFRFRLQASASTTPAVLTGWQLSGRMMPLKRYQFLGTFKTDSDATTFTDEPDHDPNTLYAQLMTWAERQTKLTLGTATPSSDALVVTVGLPSKSVDWIDSGENKWGGRISLPILEV